MSYSFDEIMSYHPTNREVYNEIKRNLSCIVPFIGAGLTQFAYCSWKQALEKLAENITYERHSIYIKSQIQCGKYLKAAQSLENFRGSANLARDIAQLFASCKLESKKGIMSQQAICLLPLLFSGLVLTTNFDETLETVYQEYGYPFQAVFHPGHSELLTQFLRERGNRGLFKLHGTISGDFIEYSHIVFTKRQYKIHYGWNAPLPKELRKCLEQKAILFLGCSLEQDITMKLLKKVLEPGAYHYTIISCKVSERDQKIKGLGKKHIRAIIYEDGRHEAVRVILERLLEETAPQIFQMLPYHAGILKPLDTLENRFSYNAGIGPLVGREKEMQELYSFLDDPGTSFRWWAIIGPGGSGKSRLVHEFCQKSPFGWFVHYLNSGDYEELSSLTPTLTQKTLLIADYAQEHARDLGRWMEQLNEQKRNLPLRMLLIERDTSEGSPWIHQLYSGVRHIDKLKKVSYKENYLKLQPLLDSDLLSIMETYASALWQNGMRVNKSLSNAKKLMLLQKLSIIDPVLCRPLYALFLTDAYVEGYDLDGWSRESTLNYVIRREQTRLDFCIRQVMGTILPDEKLQEIFLYIQCIATVFSGVPLVKLQELCPNKWAIIEQRSDRFKTPVDFLNQIGLAEKDKIPAIRPDLVGEFFVYDWLICKEPEIISEFLSIVWQFPSSSFAFFNRVINDYKYLLNANPQQWSVLLPSSLQLSKYAVVDFARLLRLAIFHCDSVAQCEKQANLLGQLIGDYPDEKSVLLEYAQGLVNLSSKQNEQGAKETVEQLGQLASNYSNLSELTVLFAKTLVNLSAKQDAQDAVKTVERLEELFNSHPSPLLVVEFSDGLVNLSSTQDGPEQLETVKSLEQLSMSPFQLPKVVEKFADGLINLIHRDKQDLQCALDAIEKLELLTIRYPNISELPLKLAQGLVNLSAMQDENDAAKTVNHLENLAFKYPARPEIVVELAWGLVNLSRHQDDAKSAQETMSRVEELVVKNPSIPEMAVKFSEGLVNLSIKQEEKGAQETAKRVETLIVDYPHNLEIVVNYSRILVNMSVKQDGQGVQKTIRQLEKLTTHYPNIRELKICFAHGLANMTGVQKDIQVRQDAIKNLEKLVADYPNIPELVEYLATGLFNLSLNQDKLYLQGVIERLMELLSNHPQIPMIAVELAKVLVNLTNHQDEQGASETINCINELANNYSSIPEITVSFAWGLYNLLVKQGKDDAQKTVERLGKLAADQPNVPETLVEFAWGLYTLSGMQGRTDSEKTLKKLEKLAAEYPNVKEIKVCLARAQDDFIKKYHTLFE